MSRAVALVALAVLAVAATGTRGSAPQITAVPASVAFGVVPLGVVARDTVTLGNAGDAPLVLGQVTVDDPQFAVGGSAGGVPPGTVVAAGGSLRVEVAFRPQALLPAAATLVIPSNDPAQPELAVPLSGTGAGPPTVSVTPDSLGVALVLGETDTLAVTIGNTGEATLAWALGVQPVSSLRDLDGVRVLWDRSKGQPGTVAWSTLAGDLAARGAIVQEIPAGTVLNASVLSAGRVYVSVDPSFEASVVWTAPETAALAAWVQGGGAILLMGDNGTTVGKFNTILTALDAGIRMSPSLGTSEVVVSGTRITAHPATEGVDRVWLGVGTRTLSPVDAPAVSLVRDNTNKHVAGVQSIGVGKLAVLCDELFDDVTLQDAAAVSAKNRLFAEKLFDYLGGDLWLVPDSTSGSLAGGASTTIDLFVDPAELRGGSYDLALRVATNDPLRPLVTVPCHLELTGFPEIAVTPTALSFGAVPQGDVSVRTLRVENPGAEPLTVTDATSSSPNFTAFPASFAVAPAEAETVTVTFAPDSVGSFVGTLTLLSNAASDPVLAVPLDGSGSVNCALPCVPPAVVPADVEASDQYPFWLDISVLAAPSPIQSFGFELEYDPRHLVFQDSARAEGLTGGFVVDAQENEPGRLTCGGFGTSPIPAGSSGTLLRLKFVAQCDTCAAGATSDLRIVEPIEDLAGTRPCCGAFTFAACPSGDGDVNTDGALSATDALCALKVYLNGQSPPSDGTCDVAGDCEAEAADADCSGAVGPADALAIYERVLCVADPTPLPCLADVDPDPCGALRAREAGALALGAPRRVDAGAWEIPVLARGEAPRAFGLTLAAEGATWAGAAGDDGWLAFEGRAGADGTIRVAGLRDAASDAANGEIGRLHFRGEGGVVRVADAVDVAFDGPAEVRLGAAPILAAALDVAGTRPAGGFEFLAAVPAAGAGALDVLDVAGRRVARIASGLPPGRHALRWDGTDDAGRPVASGIYFARLSGPQDTRVRKLVLVR